MFLVAYKHDRQSSFSPSGYQSQHNNCEGEHPKPENKNIIHILTIDRCCQKRKGVAEKVCWRLQT